MLSQHFWNWLNLGPLPTKFKCGMLMILKFFDRHQDKAQNTVLFYIVTAQEEKPWREPPLTLWNLNSGKSFRSCSTEQVLVIIFFVVAVLELNRVSRFWSYLAQSCGRPQGCAYPQGSKVPWSLKGPGPFYVFRDCSKLRESTGPILTSFEIWTVLRKIIVAHCLHFSLSHQGSEI